jgi:hypothetical protein
MLTVAERAEKAEDLMDEMMNLLSFIELNEQKMFHFM